MSVVNNAFKSFVINNGHLNGVLIKLPQLWGFSHYPSFIDSNFSGIFQEILASDHLIVVNALDFTRADVKKQKKRDAFGSKLNALKMVIFASDRLAETKRSAIVGEFNHSGKIKGFEILHLSTNTKLWISHYDFDDFVKLT
jgi:hypothetical protein